MHVDAPLAHAASVAAQRQGKFWEYRDLVFEGFPNLKRDDLIRHARTLGLDVDRFERDLLDPGVAAIVQSDVREMAELGVTGTPGFFINGRFLSGAKPFEEFAAKVDAELQRLGVPAPGRP